MAQDIGKEARLTESLFGCRRQHDRQSINLLGSYDQSLGLINFYLQTNPQPLRLNANFQPLLNYPTIQLSPSNLPCIASKIKLSP